MPVSKEVREQVKQAAGGFCELFHEYPVPGNQIVHVHHQGMGGAEDESELNQPNNLLWGCQKCHDLVDGRLKNAPYKIVRFDRSKRELEILDIEQRRISHDRIFFHQWDKWKEAHEKYPELANKITQWNALGAEVAELLAWFAPTKKGPRLFRITPELEGGEHLTPKEDFRRWFAHLGLTASKANELTRIGKWIREHALSGVVRGIDLDALDALRRADDESLEELLGLARGRPADFWDAIDQIRRGKKRKRNWVVATEDGTLETWRSVDRPEVGENEAVIRGTIVKPNSKVKEME